MLNNVTPQICKFILLKLIIIDDDIDVFMYVIYINQDAGFPHVQYVFSSPSFENERMLSGQI